MCLLNVIIQCLLFITIIEKSYGDENHCEEVIDFCSRDFVVTSSRVVVIADIHGDMDQLLIALRTADLIEDEATSWIGGTSVLVQTGDIMDRGPDSLDIFHLFQSLAQEARAAGGCIVQLLGNHELMNLAGDFRYAEADENAKYGGLQARRDSLSPSSSLGRHLRSLPVGARVVQTSTEGTNFTTIFAHAGILPWVANVMTVEQMNQVVYDAFKGASESEIRRLTTSSKLLLGHGPLWARDYAYPNERKVCRTLDVALESLGGDRMIVGHTVQFNGKPTVRCDGRLVLADTGMSKAYQGGISLVQLEPGSKSLITLFS